VRDGEGRSTGQARLTFACGPAQSTARRAEVEAQLHDAEFNGRRLIVLGRRPGPED